MEVLIHDAAVVGDKGTAAGAGVGKQVVDVASRFRRSAALAGKHHHVVAGERCGAGAPHQCCFQRSGRADLRSCRVVAFVKVETSAQGSPTGDGVVGNFIIVHAHIVKHALHRIFGAGGDRDQGDVALRMRGRHIEGEPGHRAGAHCLAELPPPVPCLDNQVYVVFSETLLRVKVPSTAL